METQEISKNKNAATIGEMVAEDYRKAEVFKKFGLDFCCGGKKSIESACNEKGINAVELNEALDALDKEQKEFSQDVNKMDLDELIDHIINTHHKYVINSLPILGEYSAKVAKVHGNTNPEVLEIADQYQYIANELRAHMHKEEGILFPYIRQIAIAKRNNESLSPPPYGTVRNPINMMEEEHDSAGNTMAAIKKLSNDYSPPEHACNTYHVLYAKLKEFEEDLHRHIHLENNILFPKAIKFEAELLS